MGCFRSREERAHWIDLEQDVQSKIIKACALRKKRANTANKKTQNTKVTSTQLGFLDDSFTQGK